MKEIETVTARLYRDREEDRRAYEFLQNAGKEKYRSLSHAVVMAVNDYFSRQERIEADPYLETREKEDAFLESIRQTVERGCQANVLGALSALLQQGIAATLPTAVRTAEEEAAETADLDMALAFSDSMR